MTIIKTIDDAAEMARSALTLMAAARAVRHVMISELDPAEKAAVLIYLTEASRSFGNEDHDAQMLVELGDELTETVDSCEKRLWKALFDLPEQARFEYTAILELLERVDFVEVAEALQEVCGG